MGVDSVQSKLGNLAVHTGQDERDTRNPDMPRKGKPRSSVQDQVDPTDPHPVVNDLGHVMGMLVNITA